jgi:hypothetical protein
MIVLVVLALLVLIVLAVVMSRKFGFFVQFSSDCEKQGGLCADVCGDGWYHTQDRPIAIAAECADPDESCCVAVT